MTNQPSALDLLKDSVKVRGLEKSGGPSTPLRALKGNLNSWQAISRTTTFGDRVVAMLNLDNIEVIRTLSPYDQPVAQVEIMTSNKEDSVWGFFAKSAARFIPEGEELDWLVGHELYLDYTDHYDGQPIMLRRPDSNGVWGDVLTDAWIISGVDGGGDASSPGAVSGADPNEALAALLVGKSEGIEAQQALLGHPSVNASPTLPSEIISGAFQSRLVDEGRVALVDGVYQAV